MATSRPSSAPLFVRESQRFDEISGWPSRETGNDPLIDAPGAHQFLGHQANHHDSDSTLGPRGNRVQDGRLPKTSGPTIGASTKANPLGSHGSSSMED